MQRDAISVPFARGRVSLTPPPLCLQACLYLSARGEGRNIQPLVLEGHGLQKKNIKIEIGPFLEQSSFCRRARAAVF